MNLNSPKVSSLSVALMTSAYSELHVQQSLNEEKQTQLYPGKHSMARTIFFFIYKLTSHYRKIL